MKIQTLIVFLIGWIFFLPASAQEVNRGEYFFNAYVDYGKGTAFAINQGQASLTVDITGVGTGINVLYVRARDNDGRWSQTEKSVFYKYQAPATSQVVEAEYFIDSYKNFGTGTKINLEAGKDDYLLEISGLDPGIHIFYLRTKNSLGVWSQLQQSVFYVVDRDIAKIVSLRYRFKGEDFTSETYTFDDFEPATEVVLDRNQFLANAKGLEEGKNYTVLITATNENGQSSMVSTALFTYKIGTPITIEKIEATNLSCFGADDGKITVIASIGDENNLEYSLDGNTFSPENVFDKLAAGDYKVYIRDKDETENMVEESVTITSPTQLSLSFQNVVQPGCPGTSTGGFRAVATGGSGTYTYRIGNQGNFQNGNTFNNLAEGTYRVTVRDASGCEAVAEVSLKTSGQTPPVPTVSRQSPGTNPAEVVLVSSAASGNQWLRNGTPISGATARTLQVTQAGSYQVRVTNSGGCQSTSAAFEVTSAMLQPPVTIEKTETSNLTCFGADDGKMTVTAKGEGTLQYSLDGKTFTASRTFENLPAGNHKVFVRSSGNTAYVTEKSFSITAPALLSLNVQNIVHPSCPGEENGTFRAAASGGTGTYTYRIGNQGSFQSGNTFSDLAEGTYQVTVRDANGCETTKEVTLTVSGQLPPIPTVTIEGTDGISTEVSLVSSSTVGNQWLKDGERIDGATGQHLEVTQAGTYQVMVTGAGGCVSLSEVVAITSAPEITTLTLKMYPNPSGDEVHIDFGRETAIDRVFLYSSNGVKLREMTEEMVVSQLRLDLTGLSPGHYIVQVEGVGLFERLKLIKQ